MPKAERQEPRAGFFLLTGGTGRLGTALRRLVPELTAPGREELDITDLSSVERAFEQYRPGVVVHSAAYTCLLYTS
ncbi:MAG: sugar nucleotide-binding protein, partial [Meiothermus sp.]|nr:sugar nucleotide-binding protein [Meiothermus sp.]